jgi:hypothetical protein
MDQTAIVGLLDPLDAEVWPLRLGSAVPSARSSSMVATTRLKRLPRNAQLLTQVAHLGVSFGHCRTASGGASRERQLA